MITFTIAIQHFQTSFFGRVTEWGDLYNRRIEYMQCVEGLETWTKPHRCLLQGGLTPGQTLHPDDLSSAMETSTNLVAFVERTKENASN